MNQEEDHKNHEDQDQLDLDYNKSDFKTSLMRRIQSIYNHVINKREEKQAMIMHRIKQMRDKNASGVKMTTYTSSNLEAFRRTMHIENYFSKSKS
jgi:CRISPR/Cas system endoribonuclease Cas6 (RAMP superfamily)